MADPIWCVVEPNRCIALFPDIAIVTEWSKGFGVRYTEDPPCGQPSTDDWGWDCWCGDFGYEQAAESRRVCASEVPLQERRILTLLRVIMAAWPIWIIKWDE